jgi:hypothetical protein
MNLQTYTFRRGEPVAFGDRVEGGAVLAGHSMRARMKPLAQGERMPGDEVALTSPALATVFVAAVGEAAAYWLHSLTAAQSLAVPAGRYLADSALMLDGVAIVVTEPVVIVLLNSASG